MKQPHLRLPLVGSLGVMALSHCGDAASGLNLDGVFRSDSLMTQLACGTSSATSTTSMSRSSTESVVLLTLSNSSTTAPSITATLTVSYPSQFACNLTAGREASAIRPLSGRCVQVNCICACTGPLQILVNGGSLLLGDQSALLEFRGTIPNGATGGDCNISVRSTLTRI